MPHHTYADQDLNRTFHIHQDYDEEEEAAIAREFKVNPMRGYVKSYASLHPLRLGMLALIVFVPLVLIMKKLVSKKCKKKKRTR
jgi:hypothetical protein